MRVLCLTFGDATQASTFYRIHQYLQPLAALGITLEPVPARQFQKWDTLAAHDVLLVQKHLFPLDRVRQLRRDAKRLIYDVDDAIWHPHGKRHFFLTNLRQGLRLKAVTRSADLCIAANSVLAEHLRALTPRVTTLSMALDENLWTLRKDRAHDGRIRIGWSGHPVNLRYLQEIEPALANVQQQRPATEFVVYSGTNPAFSSLRYTFVPYRPGADAGVIKTFDIGLLPLPGGEFAAGKSPIKGLQYLACGAAVVCSPNGAAERMFHAGKTALFARTPDQWIESLRALIDNQAQRRALAEAGRKSFEAAFSLSRNAPRFAELLKTGSGSGGNTF